MTFNQFNLNSADLLTLNSVSSHRIHVLDHEPIRLFKIIPIIKQSFSEIHLFSTIDELEAASQQSPPQVILLRFDFKPIDSIVLMQELKKQASEGCFIILYSEVPVEDFAIELALNKGADGVINFPHKASILIPYLKNLVQRLPVIEHSNRQSFYLDADKYEVNYRGNKINLPKKEFLLLQLLYTHSDKIFSKSELAEQIWHDVHIAQKRSIDVHIYNIRCSIDKNLIKSYKGKGYRFNREFSN